MAQIIYVGSFNDGLYRSVDDGATFSQIWGVTNGENYIRGIAMWNVNPGLNSVLIGCYGAGSGVAGSYAITTGGLYRLDHADVTPLAPVHELTPFNSVEEIVVLANRIYVVGSIITISASTGVISTKDDGVWMASVLGGPASNWTRQGSGVLPNNAAWCSIDGKAGATAAQDTLFIGAGASVQGSTSGTVMYDHIMRSTNGGATWQGVTLLSTAIHNEVGGPGGPGWWYNPNTFGLLGLGSTFVAAQVRLDPNNVNTLYVAGRAGTWFTRNALAANPDWYPSVQKMGVTINNDVRADPNTGGRAYVTNVDWVMFYSTDHLATVIQKGPPVPGAASPAGYSLTLDTSTTPSVVYCGVGDRDTNIAGAVYSNTDPVTQAWAIVGDLATAAAGARPFGLALLKITGTVNLLAACAGSGVWRWNGTTWARLTSAMYVTPTPDPKRHPIIWASLNLAYCYDQDSGVWRGTSSVPGTTVLDVWTKINSRTTTNRSSGYLIIDPADTSRLFLSVDAGLFRLDGAATLATATETVITGVTNPGPLDIDPNGILFEARPADVAGQAGLFRTANRSSGAPTWADISDPAYRGGSPFPNVIETTSDGYIYIAEDGTGAMVGSAAGSIITNKSSTDSVTATEGYSLFTGGVSLKFDTDDAVMTEVVTVGNSTIFSSDSATMTEGQNNPGGVSVVTRIIPRTLSPVRHVFRGPGGTDTPDVAGDWSCTELAPGGYWSAEAWVDARRGLGKPDVYRVGSTWTMYLDDPNNPLWEGIVMDVIPDESNEVHIVGRGWGQTPNRTVDRLNFMNENYQDWVASDSAPHNYQNDPAWNVDASGGRLLYVGHEATHVMNGDRGGLLFWSEGCPITAITFTQATANIGNGPYLLQILSSKGPTGGVAFEGGNVGIGVDGDVARTVNATPDGDQIEVRIVYVGPAVPAPGVPFAATRRAKITNLKVYGYAPVAVGGMTTSDVVSVLLGKLGFEDWDVEDTGDDILPVDFKTGTYTDALNYCSAFSGRTWLILSRAAKPYGRFRTPDTWFTTRDDGVTQLDPVTRYNRCVVRYLTTGGRHRQVAVTCEDMGIPDAFFGTKFVNTMTLEIVGQHHSAPAVAQHLAERVLPIIAAERYWGSLDRSYLRSATGQVVDARKAHAGDLIVVEDAKPYAAGTVTILDKTCHSVGATFSLAQNDPTLDQLLAHKAGLLGGTVP